MNTLAVVYSGEGGGGHPRSRKNSAVGSAHGELVETRLNMVGSNTKVDSSSRPEVKPMHKRPSTGVGSNAVVPRHQRRVSYGKASIDMSADHTDSTDSDAKNSVYRIAKVVRAQQRRFRMQSNEEKVASWIEPTFRVMPHHRFDVVAAREITCETLSRFLAQEDTYNPANSKKLVVGLSELIKDRIKVLDLKRFKLIVNVILGELRDQSIEVATRGLIDVKSDNFCVAQYRNCKSTIFAVAIVFGVYRE